MKLIPRNGVELMKLNGNARLCRGVSNTTEMNRHIYACIYFLYRKNCVFQVPKQMDQSLDVNFWTQLKYHTGTIKRKELQQDTVSKNVAYAIISDRDHQQVNR